MKHKLIKISLIVYLVYIIIVISSVILFIYNYDGSESTFLNLGKGYSIGLDPNSDLVLGGSRNNLIISGPIIKYQYDDKYITVKEKPREKIDTLFKIDRINKLDEYHRRFDKIKYYNYWIIDKSIDSVFGPYEKNDFRLKFKELNLPDSLMIK